MAVRALIPAERLNIAHVNSVDGSTDYEPGVAYKAGCVVTYNGNTYVANIDIEDTDTDTPDAAPDKWGLCPNAKSLVEGGEVADLENRVSALEDDVYNLAHVQLISANTYRVTIPANTVLSDAITLLYDNFVSDILSNLSDDEAVIPRHILIPIDASGNTLANPLTHVLWHNNETTSINNEVSIMRSYEGANSITIYAGMQGGSTYAHKSLKKMVISSDGTVTMTDLNNITITNEKTLSFGYYKCKKIPTS